MSFLQVKSGFAAFTSVSLLVLANAGFCDEPRDGGQDKSVGRQAMPGDAHGGNPSKSAPAAEGAKNDERCAALGVSLADAEGGASVTAVVPGSPAERVGLRIGDLIRRVNGERVLTAADVIGKMGQYRPGEQIDLMVRRDGAQFTQKVQLASRKATLAQEGRRNRSYSYDPQTSRGPSRQELNERIATLQQEEQLLEQTLRQQRATELQSKYSGQLGGNASSTAQGSDP